MNKSCANVLFPNCVELTVFQLHDAEHTQTYLQVVATILWRWKNVFECGVSWKLRVWECSRYHTFGECHYVLYQQSRMATSDVPQNEYWVSKLIHFDNFNTYSRWSYRISGTYWSATLIMISERWSVGPPGCTIERCNGQQRLRRKKKNMYQSSFIGHSHSKKSWFPIVRSCGKHQSIVDTFISFGVLQQFRDSNTTAKEHQTVAWYRIPYACEDMLTWPSAWKSHTNSTNSIKKRQMMQNVLNSIILPYAWLTCVD